MTLIREISVRLLQRLDYMRIKPDVVVALGADADYAAQQLTKRYPTANVITSLPDGKHTVDLIFSNLTLHRSPDAGGALQQFARVLKPEGLLLFTTLGPDTFKELNSVDGAFIDMHDIGDGLLNCQLLDPVMDMEFITLNYSSLQPLQQDLRALELKLNPSAAPCTATLELIYGHAWGCPEKNSAGLNEYGEAAIAVDAIRRT